MDSEKKQPPQPGPAKSLGSKFLEIYEKEGFVAANEWAMYCGGKYLEALRKRGAPVPRKPGPSPKPLKQRTDDEILSPHAPPALTPEIIDQAAWDKMLSDPLLGGTFFRAVLGPSEPLLDPREDGRIADALRRGITERVMETPKARKPASQKATVATKDILAECVIHPTHVNICCQDSEGARFSPCVPGRSNARGGEWNEWVAQRPSFRGVVRDGYCYDLCLRSAIQFVWLACNFDCDVRVMFGDKEDSGKGITGLQMLICTERFAAPLAAPPAITVEVRCFGAEDAGQCLKSLVALLESPFRKAPAEP